MFDKQNGSYIRKIGRKGPGPFEYESTRGFINPLKERIYFLRGSKDLLEFDVHGQFHRSIKLPADTLEIPPSQFSYFNDNFIGSSPNVLIDLEHWLLIFNNENIINIHPNNNIHPRTMPQFINIPQTHFYHYNDNIYFRDDYNDTVYLVTGNEISPYLVFNAGKNSLPYEAKWWPGEKISKSELLYTQGFMESEAYVFFFIVGRPENQVLIGIYNKKNRELQITDTKTGLENDIDNFISFRYLQLYNTELLGHIDAWEIEQWFKDNPDKAAQLPPHIKKLENITENDNPVVMIVRLKE